jgi:hypothetical protein
MQKATYAACSNSPIAPTITGARVKPIERLVDGIAKVYFCRFKKKTSRFQKEKAFHHDVYVILLADAVAKHPSILRLNPTLWGSASSNEKEISHTRVSWQTR